MSQSDFVNRGQALVSAGQYQEAVKVCRLGLLGRPTTVEGRVVLGQALLALKRYDEVLAEMRVALELDHTSVPAQLLKGEALLRKGDPQAAIDVLQRARLQAPSDPKIVALYADAQRSLGRPVVTASHPSVGFVGGGTPFVAEEATRNYPSHGADDEDTSDDDGSDTSGDSFTRPTSIAAPGAKKKPPAPASARNPDTTPPPSVLAVGDHSGTVEVDPDLDGVELEGDDDFGELAAPPPKSRGNRPAAPRTPGDERGQVIPSRAKLPGPKGSAAFPKDEVSGSLRSRPRRSKVDISTVELGDDEMIEIDETLQPAERGPGPGTQVRNAVKMPSGPLDARVPIAASRPTAHAPAVAPPPHLAQMLANAPYGAQMAPPPQPLPPPPRGNPIAAAMPTMAAVQPMPYGQPQMPYGQPNQNSPAAVRPTMMSAAQQQSAAAVDALFEQQQQPGSPAWARATVAAGHPNMGKARPDDATSRPGAMDPQLASMLEISSASAVMLEPSQSGARPLKTGMRKARSRLQIIVWILIGGLVIGGGVFAGFQIRAMRLDKQISAAREQAVALAKADTWKGWIGARDRLAGIAQASATPDNRSALARARALVAYEFGDGLADAKAAVEGLSGQATPDVELAAAYVALAQHDSKAAKAAAERATAISTNDAAALYVTGQAALLAGDTTNAIKSLKAAVELEPRPHYSVGLARAYAETSAWKDALAAVDKALVASPDHPGALIERGSLLAASGQIAPGAPLGTEVRGQLQKIVGEGGKPLVDQVRGVSPAEVAFAYLALTQIDFMRGDVALMQADFRAALLIRIDEQRFAEQAIETLYAIGDLAGARAAVEGTLAEWPSSRRARIAMARVLLAQGKPTDALDIVTKIPDLKDLPKALAVRGQVHFALGDLDAAVKDFDRALKKSPNLELALVGRTWIDIETGDLVAAKQRIEPKQSAQSSAAIATVYAAVLRLGNEPGARDKARDILEKVVVGPPSVDITRAQLELARIYRDTGDLRAARMYADASRTGSEEARLESGLLQIEFRDPAGGRATLDQVLKSTDRPSSTLLLEAARARMLVGDHRGAIDLLDLADKAPNVTRWKYDRERGRLALRKGDYAGAALSLTRALETCGDDVETFFLAAEVAATEEKQAKLGDRVRQLLPARLKDRPEAQIVTGKLLLSKGDDAFKSYEAARLKLEAEKATPRRIAQAYLGRAIVAYNKQDDQAALDALDFALEADPSLYEAFLYYADIAKERDPKKALAKAQSAVLSNPDLVDGYVMVGTIAHKLRNRKLLEEATTKVNDLAPNSEAFKQLQGLRF